MTARPPACVSCHVERPLDDRTWAAFSRLQEQRPGGFRIAALVRPPDQEAGEDESRWLERARAAAARGPFGLHTHWTSPSHARPTGPDPAQRVARELDWLHTRDLHPTLFAGGGWYLDEDVAETLAAAGVADCTATAFRPPYLPPNAARLGAAEPTRLVLRSGARLLELPSTHSLGMLARGVAGRLEGALVHVYFHDTDLLQPLRRAALVAALTALGRLRAKPTDLDALRHEHAAAPETPFGEVYAR
ncbi:MAG TPA: hypothetical protein VF101_04185 [Gaiellaceae bacterium]